jgi:4a-hydroxytetrahydrobiopterin dehydratase
MPVAQTVDQPAAVTRRPATATEVVTQLAQLPGWSLHGDGAAVCIRKTYAFSGFSQALGFAQALAWLAQRLDHHPELRIKQQCCEVRWSSHDVGGLSASDFEAAARTEALLVDGVGAARA